ncbi:HAD family hydrolase [Pseudomonas sp. NPDC087615]|uniref:HAD family hydrolase n=1 Tax=Pseudomonas sp. NPDC087615 TaxID=3364443 RepID=UPI0037F66CDB
MSQRGSSTAVVFDWDGTVFDTDFLIDEAIERVLKRHAPSELHRLQPFFYSSRRQTSPLKLLRLPQQGRNTVIQEIANELRMLEKQASAFDGAKTLILRLKSLGVPLAVLTRRDRASLTAQLQKCSLEHAFDVLVCRSEVPAKPDPAGLALIRQQLQAERIVMIGNSMDDMLCARNAQVEFIAVNFCTRVKEAQLGEPDCQVLSNYSLVHDALMKMLCPGLT